MDLTLMLILGLVGIGVSLLLITYGVMRLQALRRRMQELSRREEDLFLYDQYHAAALQNWAKAERATQNREWEVAEEAWRSTVQCLEKACSLPLGSVTGNSLEEELKEARRRLEQVQTQIHHQRQNHNRASPPPPLSP